MGPLYTHLFLHEGSLSTRIEATLVVGLPHSPHVLGICIAKGDQSCAIDIDERGGQG